MGRWFCNFSFNGRARRAHTWANYGAWLAVMVLIIILAVGMTKNGSPAGASAIFGLALIAAALCAWLDHMAITFRRAHDTNRSGWVWVLLLIPIVNLLPLYWLLIEDSQQGPNKYGPPVKEFYTPSAAPGASA